MADPAQTAPEPTDDLPMIEEHIDTGLEALLSGYRPTYAPGANNSPDLFEEHFEIHADRPLPEFSHPYADAFEASDSANPARQLYALVCTPDLPYRALEVADIASISNTNIILPLVAGTVYCSHLGESRQVLFFERPAGTRLSEIYSAKTRLHDSKVISLILEPICNALLLMRERKLHHGNIRPDAVFVGESFMLGECFSAPAGTLAEYFYEPVERIMADTLGHGEANEKTDVYALGILAFEALFGLDKLRVLSRAEFIDRVLRLGTYNVFSNGHNFPDSFEDFFRGVFNDNPAERWGLDQLVQFIGGKRFNMIAPTQSKDASRPFLFGQENIFSRRLLASLLHRNWRDVVRDIRTLKLERWCETSLHRPELGERIERALRNAGPHASERQVIDMMMRIVTVLDPVGPLRTKSLSVRPDGIPTMLASLAQEKGPERSQILLMLETDICAFWVEQLETARTPELSQLIWRIKRVKPYLESRSLGFGLERVLYELNPSLCCQSPILKAYHVTSIEEALLTMDVLAKNMAPDSSMVDRHIAAFIAAKLDFTREIRLNDLTNIPSLAENQELIMMQLLARAQQKVPRMKLVGLATWGGMRIEKMIDEIHNRVIRKRQKLQLKKLASSGSLREVLSSIVNREVITRDTDGFAHALALYDINTRRIEYLQNPLILEYKSRKTGGKMGVFVSFMALAIMAYDAMISIFGI